MKEASIKNKEVIEKKTLTNPEIKKLDKRLNEHSTNWTRVSMFVSIFGIMVIIFIYQMVSEVSLVFAAVLMLFGMTAFLPIGFILGYLLLDPYMRCKMKRRMRGKNYAVVNFVHKGGKRIDVRIKDLDDDVVVQGTKLWILDKDGIYYIDKDDNKIFHKTIEPDSMITRPNNVPELFLDAETMKPLAFQKTTTASTPQQVGAILLGYVNNQIAKNLFFKKTMTMFWIISLGINACTLVGLIILYDELVGI